MSVWVIHVLMSESLIMSLGDLISGLGVLSQVLVHIRSCGDGCLGLIFNSLIVADRLIHVLGTRIQGLDSIMAFGLGDIIHGLIVADWVIMPLPHFWQRRVMIVHLVCLMPLMMVSPRVRLMVSNDDVLGLLVSVYAGEV